MKEFVVTTSHRPRREQVEKAIALAKELGTEYVPRKDLKRIESEIDFYYVVESSGRVLIRWSEGELFFHPSVAKVRMKNLRLGRDYLVEALDPEGDEIVLDTTFGLGSEAILMAAFLPRGKVVGLEKSVHIYTVVREGMRLYKSKVKWIDDAIKRIELLHADFKEFIRSQPDGSYDVVYCDPMFENPRYESSSMNPLRPFASYDTISDEDVEEMVRIARKRVIIKSHVEDGLFKRIRVDREMGSKKSGVIYGIIEIR